VNDWFRSITALGAAFGSVVVVTLALAALIVSGPAVVPQPSDAAGPVPAASAPGDPVAGIPGLGGELTVTGALEGTFLFNRPADGPGYGLSGGNGRIFFDGSPLAVVQMNLDGLSFFPEPDVCAITPGNLTNAIGVGRAELRCDELTDIRGNGEITVRGSIGLPLDLLAVRELPLPGGSVTVGPETWTFAHATLEAWQMPTIAGTRSYNLELVDEATGSTLNVTFDIEARSLALANVVRDGADATLEDDGCELRSEELGQLNPRTTVVELAIDCADVEVPGLGVVPISGTVIVERLEWPE
jgi:hypothetical protein